MNREQRRAAARRALQVRTVMALDECARCGAPICPECGVEAIECECCGEFNCDRCGLLVVAAPKLALS